MRVNPLTRTISGSSLDLRLRKHIISSIPNVLSNLKKNNINKIVVIGVLIFKKVCWNNIGKYYMIKISDFESSICMFTSNPQIIEKFFKIQLGTVLVIQPILSKNNRLRIQSNQQILIVGLSIEFGVCSRMDCNDIINKNKSKYKLCHYHQNQLKIKRINFKNNDKKNKRKNISKEYQKDNQKDNQSTTTTINTPNTIKTKSRKRKFVNYTNNDGDSDSDIEILSTISSTKMNQKNKCKKRKRRKF